MNKIKRLLRRNQQGFTLIELTVVMTIMVVMAHIVMAGVSGSGDRSKEVGAMADANALFTAIVKFNGDSPNYAIWPEESLGLNTATHQFVYKGLSADGSVSNTINTDNATASPKITLTDAQLANYTQIDWNKSFEDSSGTALYFVDDLITYPKSAQLKKNNHPAHIFLLKKIADEKGRLVELYQLNADETLWEKIYP